MATFLACAPRAEDKPPPFAPQSGENGSIDLAAFSGGSTSSSLGGATSEDLDLTAEPTEPPPGYPLGPYGEGNPVVGDVVENLTFEGFPRIGAGQLASSGEVEEITFEQLRAQGENYAIVHTATIWCPSCRSAAEDFAARGDEIAAQGAVLLELVLEGNSSALPTDVELSTWVATSDLTMATVRPGDARTKLVFPSREYVYIIDLSSMKVVWAKQALFSDPTITSLGFDAYLAL
jgi:hypothetical protein